MAELFFFVEKRLNDCCFASNSAVHTLRKRSFVHLSAQTFPVLQAKSPKSVLAAALCDATLLLFRSLGCKPFNTWSAN